MLKFFSWTINNIKGVRRLLFATFCLQKMYISQTQSGHSDKFNHPNSSTHNLKNTLVYMSMQQDMKNNDFHLQPYAGWSGCRERKESSNVTDVLIKHRKEHRRGAKPQPPSLYVDMPRARSSRAILLPAQGQQ